MSQKLRIIVISAILFLGFYCAGFCQNSRGSGFLRLEPKAPAFLDKTGILSDISPQADENWYDMNLSDGTRFIASQDQLWEAGLVIQVAGAKFDGEYTLDFIQRESREGKPVFKLREDLPGTKVKIIYREDQKAPVTLGSIEVLEE